MKSLGTVTEIEFWKSLPSLVVLIKSKSLAGPTLALSSLAIPLLGEPFTSGDLVGNVGRVYREFPKVDSRYKIL